MSNLSDRLLNSLPIAICFLVGKIVTFPTYVLLRGLGRFWNVFFAELWEEWYKRT